MSDLEPGASDVVGDEAAVVAKKAGKSSKASKAKGDKKESIFARMALFFRQVVAELRKVIWPTRNELMTYTGVVLFFCLVMALIIAGLDLVFTKAVLTLFGRS